MLPPVIESPCISVEAFKSQAGRLFQMKRSER